MLGPNVTFRMAVGGSHVNACRYLLVRPTVRVFSVPQSPKLIFTARRSYATPGRPKKAVGEPTRTVKRAVKRVASDKPKPKSAGVKEKEKEKAAAVKAKAKEKAAATKAKEKAAAAKAKEAAKAAAAAAKKTKAKKDLTPEQREKAEQKLAQAVITSLKKLALSPPVSRPLNAWTVFNGSKSKGITLNGEDKAERIGQNTRQNAQEYKSLSAAELEHWNHLTNEANTKRAAEYNAWLTARTPDEIRIANQARRKLRLKLGDKGKTYHNIHDDRLVRGPISSYFFFSQERYGSKDFNHIKLSEASKLASEEWKTLTNGEKQKYDDLAAKDRERYFKECQDVYGHAPSTSAATSLSA